MTSPVPPRRRPGSAEPWTFSETLAYLDRHVNLEKMVGLAGRTEGLSLDRMRVLAGVLGDPQHAYPGLQVTGTNGKGSTVRMIEALLTAHDIAVGSYTSPHLEEVVERITWAGERISRDELARVVGDLAMLEPLLLEELGGERPSYFELLTAVAFSYFAEVAVGAAVVEVGMLGRFDATNVADADVAVITNVGKDHTDGRGDWRRRVAEEKAGIIKPATRVVLGETDPDLVPVFEAEGAAELWLRDRDFGVLGGAVALGGRVVDLEGPFGRYDQVFLPLHGARQADNAACAVAAVEAFFGRALDGELVREVFAGLELPGRFEVLHRRPLLLLDGAHNPPGAVAAAETLDEEFAIAGRRRWVLGLLAGRDVDEMLDAFGVTGDDHLVVCTPPTPRAIPAEAVAERAARRGVEVDVVDDVAAAVAQAWERARPGDGEASDEEQGADAPGRGETGDAGEAGDAVIVTGSLYTVGAARKACRELGLFE